MPHDPIKSNHNIIVFIIIRHVVYIFYRKHMLHRQDSATSIHSLYLWKPGELNLWHTLFGSKQLLFRVSPTSSFLSLLVIVLFDSTNHNCWSSLPLSLTCVVISFYFTCVFTSLQFNLYTKMRNDKATSHPLLLTGNKACGVSTPPMASTFVTASAMVGGLVILEQLTRYLLFSIKVRRDIYESMNVIYSTTHSN